MPDTDITRAQAKARARLLHVRSYDIDLDFTRGPQTFGSVSVIRFGCREPGASANADLIATAVREITLNGVPLDPATAWADGRITLPGLAACNELRVAADCAYTTSGTGMHRADSADGSVHIYAKLAQAYARTAYACFDQPDLKAAFTFTVTAPAHWTVLSNQPQDSSERVSGDSRVVRFLPSRRLPAFTTTVVAGDYHMVTAAHTTPDGQEIPLELACRADLAGRLDSEALFSLTATGLDYYTRWLDAPYPYAKYGHVFVPELSCTASEDAGCVLMSERMLDEPRPGVVLHEMAHMWFGDCATQEWWDDLWLSEAVANYCEFRSQQETGLDPGAWPVMSVTEQMAAFAEDRLPSSHPVASGAATVSEAIATFDGILYAKGAAVLRQLSAYVGDENFTAALRAYIARHRYGNATRADLIAALETASGKDLAEWSKAWLETTGPNVLRPEFSTDPAGRFISFAVLQEGVMLRPHQITVGLYRRSGDALTRVNRVEVDVTGDRTEVPALAGAAQPDLILLNDDGTGYVLVRFDPRSLETVSSSAGGLPGRAARAVCWNAVADMVRQAELPVSAFTAMLADAARSESSLPVLAALRTQAEWLVTRFADPARYAQVPATAEETGKKEDAWRLMTSATTGPETIAAVAGAFTRCEHTDLLTPYAARYLAEMPGLWRDRDPWLRVRLAKLLFPYPAVTPEFLTRVDEFLADGGLDRGLARIVRDHRDTAARALRARGL